MIVRTYTAELAGPVVAFEDVGVMPVRRIRAWTATFGALTLQRANAAPVAVGVVRGGAAWERVPVRSPETPLLGALGALSAASSLLARRTWR